MQDKVLIAACVALTVGVLVLCIQVLRTAFKVRRLEALFFHLYHKELAKEFGDDEGSD